MQKNLKLYFTLFSSTFLLSAFTFGGGYVIVPLMRKKFTQSLGWIDEEEMLDIVALSQSSPGPIAVNASILVGYRMAGVLGAIITVLGTVLPPLIIISVISLFYDAFRDNKIISLLMLGMQAGVAAVIVDAVINMGKGALKQKKILPLSIMLISFCLAFIFKINVVYIILLSALIGVMVSFYGTRKNIHKGDGNDLS